MNNKALKTKKTYSTPMVESINVDREVSMIMMSEAPPFPNDLNAIPGWAESGWTQKVFKLIFR